MAYFCSNDHHPVWDGVDFSRCWRKNIIPGALPLGLLALSVMIIVPTILRRVLVSRNKLSLSSTDQHISTVSGEKPSLHRIEDRILFESVHSSFEESIDAGTLDDREKTAMERLGDWIGAVGAIGFVIVQSVYIVMMHGRGFERLAFFVYMTLLALTAIPTTKTVALVRYIPQTHFGSLLWLYAPVQFIIFRSTILHHPHPISTHHPVHHHLSSKTSLIFESILLGHTILLLLAYNNVPFRTRLDGILEGLKAGKGNGARRPVVIGYAADKEDAYTVLDNPAEPRSVMSRALFSHVIPIVLKHYKDPMQVKDVPAIREDDIPAVSVANWRLDQRQGLKDHPESKGKKKRQTKFAFRLFWHFRQLFWLQTFWSVMAVIFSFFSPISLQLLLKFVADRKSDDPTTRTPTHVAVLYVALMVIGQLGSSVSQSQILNTGRRICIRARAVIITEIYCKALRRRDMSGAVSAAKPTPATEETEGLAPKDTNAASEQKTDTAEANITNLVGVDAFFISEIAGYLYYFVTCPLCIIVALLLLYRLLGVSSLAGVAMMLLLTPLQGFITRAFARTQGKLLGATDARLEAATEVLNSIKTIKFAAWEDKFYDRMQKSRDHELNVLKTRFNIRVLANVVTQITPPLVTVVTFAFYTLYFKQPLTAATAFTSLSLFSMIRTPLAAILEMITAATNAFVSAARVEDFLGVEETLKYDQLSVATKPEEPTIGFVKAVIKHAGKDDEKIKIHDMASGGNTGEDFRLHLDDISFPVGKMSIIVGSVGSGKTTLLNSLLGETTLLDGKIFMVNDQGDRELCEEDLATGLTDTVAYCPQAPWLIGATIRENILFGRAYDEKRYSEVIAACALERDLEIWEDKDRTLVGEKGTVCSGGQKARIALARAIYSSSRTVLCDDVTSAVDAHTARHLYQKCFKGPLMAGRTLILVTHAVGLVLSGTDYAVVLDGGATTGVGTPTDLRSRGYFAEEELVDDGEHLTTHLSGKGDPASLPSAADGTLTTENLEDRAGELENAAKQVDIDNADPAAKKEKFFKAESQATGSIGFSVYATYFKYMGSWFYWILLVVLFLGSQTAQIETNAWIRNWANAVEHAYSALMHETVLAVRSFGERHGIAGHDDSLYYLVVYVLINVLFGALVAGRTLATFQASLKASHLLYGQLLKAVLGARMRFFDSTPSGQILNRLSNDIQVIDQQAAEVMMLFANSVLNTAAVLVVVTFATPAFIFAAIFISGLYGIIGALYNATSLEVKRCDSVTKSPILVGFSEVLHGQTSIRAYADTARFTRDLMTRLETNIRAFHLLWQNNRLLSIYCDVAGSLVIVFAAMFVLLNDSLDAGAAGLSLSYALTFTDFVLWIVRLWAANEQNMTSVERLRDYLKLEPEAIPSATEPPAYWPTKEAKIEIEDLTCAYAPGLPAVLKNVSFTVEPGHRVGICGRTGSGKSTLALSLFRFIEASSGRIKIDGIDISTITLAALRGRLTILPQEAQLFSGSVRENLDPFGEHDDGTIWSALRRCGLAPRATPGASALTSRVASRATSLNEEGDSATVVEEKVMINSLDERVAKGGANYSAGQRQLLSLARGLIKLQHSSILVLDESTANLDHATDEAIQRVLKENLDGVTVITIAHRLRTLMDCDRILVLDHGHVLEYDSPLALMNQETSSFRDLCRRSGEESTLLRMAEQAEKERRR